MIEKQYLTVLGALADKINDKDLEILVLKHQIDELKKALAAAQEAEHNATA